MFIGILSIALVMNNRARIFQEKNPATVATVNKELKVVPRIYTAKKVTK